MSEAKPEAKAQLRQLSPAKLKRAEFERQTYRIYPEYPTALEDVLKPEYWSHVGKTLRHYDKIEVVFEDGSVYAELLVMDCGPQWAKVAILSLIDLREAKADAETVRESQEVSKAPYKVEWKGPNMKWTVIRSADGEKLKVECQSKEDAAKWLDGYLKTLNK